MITITEASFDDTANDSTCLDKSSVENNQKNLAKFRFLQRKVKKLKG
jgi:hypothetical protein